MKSQKTQAAFVKSQVAIGSLTADVFVCQESGHYFYSLTSVAALIGKSESSARSFLTSKAFKALHGGDFQPAVFTAENLKYILLPCDVAFAYLINWVAKGSQEALIIVKALGSESLEIRAAKAFQELTPTKVDTIQWKTNQRIMSIHELNEYRKGIGKAWLDKFAGGKIHDRLTMLVFGQTASEAILANPLVDGRPTVGLNHQEDPELMEILIACKVESLRYKKGTHEEMVDRAYETVMKRRQQRLA